MATPKRFGIDEVPMRGYGTLYPYNTQSGYDVFFPDTTRPIPFVFADERIKRRTKPIVGQAFYVYDVEALYGESFKNLPLGAMVCQLNKSGEPRAKYFMGCLITPLPIPDEVLEKRYFYLFDPEDYSRARANERNLNNPIILTEQIFQFDIFQFMENTAFGTDRYGIEPVLVKFGYYSVANKKIMRDGQYGMLDIKNKEIHRIAYPNNDKGNLPEKGWYARTNGESCYLTKNATGYYAVIQMVGLDYLFPTISGMDKIFNENEKYLKDTFKEKWQETK